MGFIRSMMTMETIQLTKNPEQKELASDDEDTEIPITNTSKTHLDNRPKPAIELELAIESAKESEPAIEPEPEPELAKESEPATAARARARFRAY
jgi:hypothetical protein